MIVVGWLLLFSFAVRRFLKRKQNPFFTFLFVGLGVGEGLVGSFLQLLYYADIISGQIVLHLGRICFFDMMVLAPIVGIGWRLITGILRFQEILQIQTNAQERPKNSLSIVPKSAVALALCFVVSIAFKVLAASGVAYFLRAVVVTYVAFVFWTIHKRSPLWKCHGLFIMAAC